MYIYICHIYVYIYTYLYICHINPSYVAYTSRWYVRKYVRTVCQDGDHSKKVTVLGRFPTKTRGPDSWRMAAEWKPEIEIMQDDLESCENL